VVFAALVTDVRLTDDLTGWDVARHARELSPAMPVVYLTGDSGVDWASQGVPNSILITKPFALAQVSRRSPIASMWSHRRRHRVQVGAALRYALSVITRQNVSSLAGRGRLEDYPVPAAQAPCAWRQLCRYGLGRKVRMPRPPGSWRLVRPACPRGFP
jgi:hypothetical protein